MEGTEESVILVYQAAHPTIIIISHSLRMILTVEPVSKKEEEQIDGHFPTLLFVLFIRWFIIQMSELSLQQKPQKTREDYSRNVKKLKLKLSSLQTQISALEKKVDSLTNTSNDKLISMKIVKFCKERRFTPEMLFRFADRTNKRVVSKVDFRATLTQLGLKFSKDQFLRLEYLIDEDLSGEISYQEYNGYLDAFGIKKEFSPGDQLARDVLQKIDIGKVLQMVEDNKQDSDNKGVKNHANLLNYQEFIKYCHKHFPSLKNKELASIFNRLEKNQLINLQDLIDYLENQEAEKKRLEEKNKKKPLKRQDTLINSFVNSDKTLKNIIQALLKSRNKESTVFHSIEFAKLERILNTKRGDLLKLFQEIDKNRKGHFLGSFTYNQLICYYINKTEKSDDLSYAFELMGFKIKSAGQSADTVISQYAENATVITEAELKKFFEGEFQLGSKEYTIISKLFPKVENGKYEIQSIIELLKYKDGKRIAYIRPNMICTRLVFKNGRQALKCCLEIEEKLAKMKQMYWNDYQFGPIESDQFGAESLNLPMPSQQTDWFRCEQLGMNEFFKQGGLGTTFACSSICPNQTFTKSLFTLVSCNPEILWNFAKVDAGIKDIQEQHLNHIFSGIYPLAFHHFAKYGIYVIKLFIKENWKYVIVDSKIPCAPDKTPFFSSVANRRYSFMSIIQKAYAKALGSYSAIYSASHPNKYAVQLASLLPVQYALQKTMQETAKNATWEAMVKFQKDQLKAFKENKKQRFHYGVVRSKVESLGKEFPINVPLKIDDLVEIPDNKSKNTHKSHRLLLMKVDQPLKDETLWNKSWNREQAGNKYSQLNLQLADKLTDPSVLKSKNLIVVNYKLFRSIFSLLRFEPVNFNTMIILRKDIQFQEKYKCRYEITAKSDLEIVIILTQRSVIGADTRIALDIKTPKEELISHQSLKQQISITPVRVQKSQSITLQLFVQNWKNETQYNYILTFYMKHPRYELKQRDRHLLFRFVSPYQQQEKLSFSDFQQAEKDFIYRNFYRGAERRGCCG